MANTDTFYTAIWEKDKPKVNALYEEKGWGKPDYWTNAEQGTQPLRLNQEEYDGIKDAGIEVDVMRPL